MPDAAIFVLGGLVTAVVIGACVLVGRAEAADALERDAGRRDPRPS